MLSFLVWGSPLMPQAEIQFQGILLQAGGPGLWIDDDDGWTIFSFSVVTKCALTANIKAVLVCVQHLTNLSELQ